MTKYDREIEELKSALVYAYQNWEIWWFIRNEKYNYKTSYNKYLVFFNNSQIAHFYTTIITTWQLLDKKNISIIKLYNKLCNDSALNENIKRDIDERLNGIDHIKKGIILIRHNVIAHISENIDAHDVFEKAMIDGWDIRNIIVQLGNILNIMIDAIGQRPLAFTLVCRGDKPDEIMNDTDIKNLFDDLEKMTK